MSWFYNARVEWRWGQPPSVHSSWLWLCLLSRHTEISDLPQMLLRFQFKLGPEPRIFFLGTHGWKMQTPRDKPLSSSPLFFFSYPSFFHQTKPHSDTFITTSILQEEHGQTIITSVQELATSALVHSIEISSHCRSW